MATILELSQNRQAALAKAESIIATAENAGRALTASESSDIDASLSEARDLVSKISTLEARGTLKAQFPNGLPTGSAESPQRRDTKTKQLSSEYASAFHSFVASGGKNISAALYEGSNAQGGFAVPITVAGEILPLAPVETGIRTVATVLTTSSDIRIPRQLTFSVASAKAESGATVTSFTESEATLDSITLSAYMAGTVAKLSFELLQDVGYFQQFVIADMVRGQQAYEEPLFVSGSGVGQPQGLLGNTGAGITGALADANGHYVSLDALEALTGVLKSAYHPNASWLMNRVTSIGIRAAQRQQNLFEPAFTRVGDKEYLFSYPVTYTSSMPVPAPGNTPVLFGDMRAGFVVADRGTNSLQVKVLDQTLALQGQVAILCYRRVDSRVRIPEAIQALTLHS